MERPNRSDMHLSADEEAKVEEETREYFDGLAPKRHSKPQRSEYSNNYVDNISNDTESPEYLNFQQLQQTDSQKLVYKGSKVPEEFVETEYYQDLNCVDKQHHTTGTGFIEMEKGKYFSLEPDTDKESHPASKGNPATNDWIPSSNETRSPREVSLELTDHAA
ncbi:uncharacterized protein [Rutidosis leptorrhynchoides]|uniref:uncharacterized protein n=1 Tax=Rutidosis leptorrhynchoides TaxID=125765 RepID=UPI003A99855C